MAETIPVKIIARIRTDFATKFGVPRQSGLVESLRGEIVFEPDFRNPDALRGIEDFSHLRSPYRPNPIGLSSVKLEGVEQRAGKGTVLIVSGADLMDGTPILDIKPYLPYADCRPDATGGFTDAVARKTLGVVLPDHLLTQIPEDKRQALHDVLAQDPRPAYQKDPARQYGLTFAGYDVRFCVRDGVLTVTEVIKVNIS